MSPPPSPASPPPQFVACPACGERLAVRAEQFGHKGQCRKCGAVFRIGEKSEQDRAHSADGGRPPVTTTFPCSLCETRITVKLKDVGKTVQCPDCGRKNVIPPPTPVQAPKAPAAMSGDQYGLWAIGEGPSQEELRARTPKLHPVECGLCGTLMYATDRQIGKNLKCPDCGAEAVARPRPPIKPIGPVLVPEGEEYQLDETAAPTPRPAPAPIAVRDLEIHAEARGEGGERRPPVRRRVGEERITTQPERPAIPLVQGISRMLLTSEILTRWAMLSLTLTVVGWFISWILHAMGSQVFMAMPLYAIGCVFGAVWMLSALPLGLAIVVESSEGSDRLEDPPHWFSLDFAEALFVAIAATVSAIPAWLTTKATTTLPVEAQTAIAAGTWLLCFPIALLSGLEQSSALAVFSPRLAWSLLRCAGPWLLFYLQSAMIAGASGFIAWKTLSGKPALWPILPWLIVAAGLLYMRLLGRLAWWIAETMPAPVEAKSE